MIRVTHVINGLGRGGAETALLRLIEDTHTDIAHTVITLTAFDQLAQQMRDIRGTQVVQLGAERGSVSPGMVLKCRRRILEARPDIIHCWLRQSCVVGTICARVGSLRHIPIIWGVRNNTNRTTMQWSDRVAYHVGRWLSPYCDAIVANSLRALKEMGAAGYRPRSQLVILNGVDLPDQSSIALLRAQTRDRLGIDRKSPVITFVGRLGMVKGPDVLVRTIDEVVIRLPDAKILRVGRPTMKEERSSWSDAIEASTSIRFLGELTDVLPVLAASDVLIMPSHSEGCPNIVLEAMAAGLPVASTDVGDVRLIMGPCGEVVPAGDWQGLADAVCRLATLSSAVRQRQASLSRARIVDGYLRKNVAGKYRQLYRQLSAEAALNPR